MLEPILGEIIMWAGADVPINWARCEGQLLPISANTALFSIMGTQYGGDGVTTFGLPDLRGRVAIHHGQGSGLSNRSIGDISGIEEVNVNSTHIPSHSHVVTDTFKCNSTLGDLNSPANNFPARTDEGKPYSTSSNATMSSGMLPVSVDEFTGGGQEHTNMQPYLVVGYIIALAGLYPTHP